MTDFSGLQIDVRCIKCGRPSTASITLFEMQNHLYICNDCRQQAEQGGKHIKWREGLLPEQPGTSTLPMNPARTRVLTNSAPPDSLFGRLGLPLSASIEEIEAAIAQRMRQLLREEDSPEREQNIEQLHSWQEMIETPATFEAYRESLKPSRHSGQALSVGDSPVYSLEDFLKACENSREGWADGERYLRTAELQHWIIFQVENRDLANKIRYYQNLTKVSNFRALNEALYCLIPARPFRFYEQDAWQPLETIPSASTPGELASLCDIQWELGEHHFYEGSLVYWLEEARGIRGLKAYCKAAVEGYVRSGRDRGVGLELLLEQALPTLPKPQVVVTFDGIEGQYVLDHWDRELLHQPISVNVTNTSRGFTSINLELEQHSPGIEPTCLVLNNAHPFHIAGAPGYGDMPARQEIVPINLPLLRRGQKYRRTLTMTVAGAYGQPPKRQDFPITLRTQRFYEGLRGILWRWGLRGGFVGLGWNFAAGIALAFLLYLLIPVMIPSSYIAQPVFDVSFGSVMQSMFAGTVALLRPPDNSHVLGTTFLLVVGGMTGLLGFFVGYGKGHIDHTAKQGSSAFCVGAFWLSLAFLITLLIPDQGWSAIGQAFQNGTDYTYVLNAFALAGGGLIVVSLGFIVALIVAATRHRLEKYLRERCEERLNLPGRA